MTNEECQTFMDVEIRCYTRVSGAKVEVRIVEKVQKPGNGHKTKTEWSVKRIDNDRPLSSRHARALHKSKDFTVD